MKKYIILKEMKQKLMEKRERVWEGDWIHEAEQMLKEKELKEREQAMAKQRRWQEQRGSVQAATVQEQPDADTAANSPRAELFEHGAAGDRALIEWLRARQSQPRRGILLQQICEWKAMDRGTIRNLAKAQ